MANEKVLILYHANCVDGMGALWALRQRWPNADAIPCSYGKDWVPPYAELERIQPDIIVIADFSFRRADMIVLFENYPMVVVLDHHKTAAAELAGLAETYAGSYHEIVPDMEKSGAMLCWEYATDGLDVPLHEGIKLIQDRDLWKFEHGELSRDFHAVAEYTMSVEGYQVFDILMQDFTFDTPSEPLLIGKTLRKRHMAKVEQHARRSFWVYDLELKFYVRWACAPYEYASDLGNMLVTDSPYAVIFNFGPDGLALSFRSRAPDGVDVSEIAQQFGGGGHKHAAGGSAPGCYSLHALTRWDFHQRSAGQQEGTE
jgi:uncharacterized protein